MKNIKAIETGILIVSFLIVGNLFPSGGFLTANGNLINFWGIPLTFLLMMAFLDSIQDTGKSVPKWVFQWLFVLSRGVGLGLSFGSVLILNAWYSDPDNGQWEPFFTAIGLGSAAILFAANWFNQQYRH